MNLRCRGGEVALCPESGCYVGYSLTVSAETAFWLPEPWMHSSALMTLNSFTWDLPPHTPGPGAWFELSFGGLVLVGAFIGWVLVPRSAAVMPASASGYQGIWCWFLGSVLCLSCHHTSLWAVWPGYSMLWLQLTFAPSLTLEPSTSLRALECLWLQSWHCPAHLAQVWRSWNCVGRVVVLGACWSASDLAFLSLKAKLEHVVLCWSE